MKEISLSYIKSNPSLFHNKSTVAIVGAGLSVPSNIPDFRSNTGYFKTLKTKHRVSGEDVFSYRFSVDRETRRTYLGVIGDMKGVVEGAEPNGGHLFLRDNCGVRKTSVSVGKTGVGVGVGKTGVGKTGVGVGVRKTSVSKTSVSKTSVSGTKTDNHTRPIFKSLRVYTQNIDGLEEKAGLKCTKEFDTDLVYLHGNLNVLVCTYCGYRIRFTLREGEVFRRGEEIECERCMSKNYGSGMGISGSRGVDGNGSGGGGNSSRGVDGSGGRGVDGSGGGGNSSRGVDGSGGGGNSSRGVDGNGGISGGTNGRGVDGGGSRGVDGNGGSGKSNDTINESGKSGIINESGKHRHPTKKSVSVESVSVESVSVESVSVESVPVESLSVESVSARSGKHGQPVESVPGRPGKAVIGLMNTNIIHYYQPHPDSHFISQITKRDTNSNLLLVMGTSLKVYGARRLVKYFSSVARLNNGKAVFVNRERVAKNMMECFDLFYEGEIEDFCEAVSYGCGGRVGGELSLRNFVSVRSGGVSFKDRACIKTSDKDGVTVKTSVKACVKTSVKDGVMTDGVSIKTSVKDGVSIKTSVKDRACIKTSRPSVNKKTEKCDQSIKDGRPSVNGDLELIKKRLSHKKDEEGKDGVKKDRHKEVHKEDMHKGVPNDKHKDIPNDMHENVPNDMHEDVPNDMHEENEEGKSNIVSEGKEKKKGKKKATKCVASNGVSDMRTRTEMNAIDKRAEVNASERIDKRAEVNAIDKRAEVNASERIDKKEAAKGSVSKKENIKEKKKRLSHIRLEMKCIKTVEKNISKNTAVEKNISKNTAVDKEVLKNTAVEKNISKNAAVEKDISKNTAVEKNISKNTAVEKNILSKKAVNKEVLKNTAVDTKKPTQKKKKGKKKK